MVATAANLGGLALGPLVAGAPAQWGPAPLRTPYIVVGALMAVLLVLVLTSPETIDTEAADRDRPVRFALRPGQRATFGAAAAVGFFVFAVMGLFSSLGAIIVRGELGITSYFIAGLAPFAAFAASAVAQLALGKLAQSKVLAIGALLFPIGLALTALSLYKPTLWLALTAAALAGGGAGLLIERRHHNDPGSGRPRLHGIEARCGVRPGAGQGPQILSAGAPITTPGGHCHFLGGETAGSTTCAPRSETGMPAGARSSRSWPAAAT